MGSAIEFLNVSKCFRLSHERARSFQDVWLGFFRGVRRSKPEKFWALRDISFHVERGETFALIGTNGSGKSTALKLLSQIIYPTNGTISINGRLTALLELGTGFHPDLTGRENIFLNGSIIGLSHKDMERRFEAIVDFAELSQFVDIPVRNYSSGMLVRLGFAVATHVEPEILVVDEVLAVGDEAYQKKCLQHIASLQRTGVTIMLVSHDLEIVRGLCQRAIWLDHGQIIAKGHVEDVTTAYLSFIRQLESKNAPAIIREMLPIIEGVDNPK